MNRDKQKEGKKVLEILSWGCWEAMEEWKQGCRHLTLTSNSVFRRGKIPKRRGFHFSDGKFWVDTGPISSYISFIFMAVIGEHVGEESDWDHKFCNKSII